MTSSKYGRRKNSRLKLPFSYKVENNFFSFKQPMDRVACLRRACEVWEIAEIAVHFATNHNILQHEVMCRSQSLLRNS